MRLSKPSLSRRYMMTWLAGSASDTVGHGHRLLGQEGSVLVRHVLLWFVPTKTAPTEEAPLVAATGPTASTTNPSRGTLARSVRVMNFCMDNSFSLERNNTYRVDNPAD